MSPIDLPKIYNPQNQTPQELIKSFVVRMGIFQDIFNEIKTSKMEHPEQHYIIQGVRGQGKTSLLLRIAYEIEKDKTLNKKLIPIVFSEEQYKVRKLYKLWEETADYLRSYSGFENLYDDMQSIEYDENFEEKCFQLLENTLKKNSKKLILFIDNISDMLNKFTENEHHRLREILIVSAEIRIIGASAESLEFHHDYSKPFYKFFRMPVLKGLNQNETKTLLKSLGEIYKRERVKEIVQNQPGRVEALRRMTGGVIRTIIILYQIFVDDENGNAFHDLEKILDEVTPLYKQRMDHFSAQQQEIVDIIALNWDAISTKDIAMKAREKSKAVSSQLKFLVRNQIIEQQGTNTKNYLYRLSERFLNIWYLMRHGGKNEKNKVKWLVEFLQCWCDEKTLINKVIKHIEALRAGRLYHKYAYYITEALAKIPSNVDLQHVMIAETKDFLDKVDSPYTDKLTESDKEIMTRATQFYKSKEYSKAFVELIKIKNVNETVYNNLGLINMVYKKNYKQAENFFLKAIDLNYTKAKYNIAFLYRYNLNDFQKAKEYYLMAIEDGITESIYQLATLYDVELSDYIKAEKYYNMSISNGLKSAYNDLALMYHYKLNKNSDAERYYLLAIKNNIEISHFNIAQLYRLELNKYSKSKKHYEIAISKDIYLGYYGLGILYHEIYKQYEKAKEKYYLAIKYDLYDAYTNLGIIYHEIEKNIPEAIKCYMKAIEKKDVVAMYNLGLLYYNDLGDKVSAIKFFKRAAKNNYADAYYQLGVISKNEDLDKATGYYLKAIDFNVYKAYNELSWMYFENILEKLKALEYAKKGYKIEKSIYIAHTYAMILLWNNEIEEALKISKDFMENEEAYKKFPNDIRQFLMFLIAKNQYHSTLKIFNENSFQLKDRYKPVYYALMFFLQDEYPNEYIKMGSELKQTVEEIITEINKMSKDYK